jgi:hypothetical protein
MQTTGATQLAVERCSLASVRLSAYDGRGVRGLLYLAAVHVLGQSQSISSMSGNVLRRSCFRIPVVTWGAWSTHVRSAGRAYDRCDGGHCSPLRCA